MTKLDQYKNIEQEATALATKYSATRLKIETLDFDFDYKRGQDGSFNLVSLKAVVRALGKTTKVPIGEGCEHATYEAAYEATKNKWSEYYRGVRAKRSPAQLAAEAKRQRRYRARRRQSERQWGRQT